MDSPGRRPFQFSLTALLAAAILVGALLGAAVAFYSWFTPTRVSHIRLINQSGAAVADVVLEWHPLNAATQKVSTRTPWIQNGRDVKMEVSNDIAVAISYSINGVTHTHQSMYVDLWQGETYEFIIKPDASVIATHASNLNR